MVFCSFYHLVLSRAPRGELPHHRPKSRRGIGFSVGCRRKKIGIYRLEQVTGVEPVSPPWQGGIIAAIRYLRFLRSEFSQKHSLTQDRKVYKKGDLRSPF